MATTRRMPGTPALALAEQAAGALSDTRVVEAASAPCPIDPQPTRWRIDVIVVGEDGTGLDGIRLLLIRGDGKVLAGKTGPVGSYQFKGLAPGSYELGLPDLDREAWFLLDTEPLSKAEATCTSTAEWMAAPVPAAAVQQTHVIRQGECIGKIAQQYGFTPDSIWQFGPNRDLANLRHDAKHVLYRGDVVVIPARQCKTQVVATGNRVTLRRPGVPEYLHIRFMHHDETPRAGVSYLLSLVTDDGGPNADIAGITDDRGFVDQPIPPNAIHATVTLNPGSFAEIHEFNLGYVDPIDEVSGWQARLNNLGYDCGPEDNQLGPKTESAIRAFQRAKGVPETGIRDEATKKALLALALT